MEVLSSPFYLVLLWYSSHTLHWSKFCSIRPVGRLKPCFYLYLVFLNSCNPNYWRTLSSFPSRCRMRALATWRSLLCLRPYHPECTRSHLKVFALTQDITISPCVMLPGLQCLSSFPVVYDRIPETEKVIKKRNLFFFLHMEAEKSRV